MYFHGQCSKKAVGTRETWNQIVSGVLFGETTAAVSELGEGEKGGSLPSGACSSKSERTTPHQTLLILQKTYLSTKRCIAQRAKLAKIKNGSPLKIEHAQHKSMDKANCLVSPCRCSFKTNVDQYGSRTRFFHLFLSTSVISTSIIGK